MKRAETRRNLREPVHGFLSRVVQPSVDCLGRDRPAKSQWLYPVRQPRPSRRPFLDRPGPAVREREHSGVRRPSLANKDPASQIILSADRLIGERFKGLPRSDKTAEPEVEHRKQMAGFDILRIERTSSFSAADDRPYLPVFIWVMASSSSALFLLYPTIPRLCVRAGQFLVGFLRGTLVRSHVLTLADQWAQTGSNGWFQPDSIFGANRRKYVAWGNCEQMRNPDAIMTHIVSILSLCFSSVRASQTFNIWGATSKLHSIRESANARTIAGRKPLFGCVMCRLWYRLLHALAHPLPGLNR